MKSFVGNGLGVALLPKLALQGPRDDSIVVLPFEEAITRDLNLIRSKGRYATVASRAFMVHMRTQVVSRFTTLAKPLPFPVGLSAGARRRAAEICGVVSRARRRRRRRAGAP